VRNPFGSPKSRLLLGEPRVRVTRPRERLTILHGHNEHEVAERLFPSSEDVPRARASRVSRVLLTSRRRISRSAASIEAGEPSIIAEHGDGTGAGPVRAGQASPYNGGDGRQEAREPGAAGQREDAAVAAERAHKDGAGANDGEQAQIDEEAEEEVLPWNG